MLKKLLFLVISILVSLLTIAIIRAILISNDKPPPTCATTDFDYVGDSFELTKRLSEAIKYETISFKNHVYNESELLKFKDFIYKKFPLIHSSSFVSKEIVNNYSLLYYVQGQDKSLKPYLIAGHLDVVPVEDAFWEVPPFSGQIKDGYVWGRGTIDCKHVVMGVLEAVEFLLSKGFKPQRSFYLAFGHDEEVNGLDGASNIGKLLKSRKISLEYILDEGSFVLDKIIPGIDFPIALISTSEKGSLNLELKVQGVPGHSSFPKKETPIVILAKALSKLEGNVFPSMFGLGPERQMIEQLAYCVPFPYKVVMGNIWLFKPFIQMFLSSPLMSALHRTTAAVTMVSGGNKINVIPSSASAGVNVRVHPAQTINEAVDYIRRIIGDDRVKIDILTQVPPHPVSPMDSFGYTILKKSILQIFNDSCVVPTTLIANTDTKWYLDLTRSIYRFSLVRMPQKDTVRFHGHNERISVKNYVQVVNFFLHLIKNSDESSLPMMHEHQDL